MAVRFISGLASNMTSFADRLVVAVDLGFSKSARSCGVAWRDGTGQPQSQGFRFGDCINSIAALLEGHSTAVLIIEAPLSALFSSAGNPVERGEFERREANCDNRTTRYWYSGPGAATCLAAVFFLRQLTTKIEQLPQAARPSEIFLYEGFVTFKPQTTEHVSDAELLLDCFFGTQPCSVVEVKATDGQVLIALTDVVAGATARAGVPTVIAPSKLTV